MGDIYQTDLVGPRYLRGTKGVTWILLFSEAGGCCRTCLFGQVSILTNRVFPCANTLLKHGEPWVFPKVSCRWIRNGSYRRRTVPSQSLSGYSSSLAYGHSYGIHSTGDQEKILLRVLTISGRKGCSEDILALPLRFSKNQ